MEVRPPTPQGPTETRRVRNRLENVPNNEKIETERKGLPITVRLRIPRDTPVKKRQILVMDLEAQGYRRVGNTMIWHREVKPVER